MKSGTAATGADSLPPLPRPDIPVGELILDPIDEPYYSKRTVEQVRNMAIAPYAERIRQLERELATFKGEHATQLATKSIDTDEFRSMMVDYRGAGTRESARRVLKLIIAYIDGRTAGPVVPNGHFLVGPGTVQVNDGFEQFTKKQINAAKRLGSLLYHATAPSQPKERDA
jgi:hypothetical protein